MEYLYENEISTVPGQLRVRVTRCRPGGDKVLPLKIYRGADDDVFFITAWSCSAAFNKALGKLRSPSFADICRQLELAYRELA